MTLRRVTVATRDDEFTSVSAHLYGEWAAHRAVGPGKGWTVTYLPSGRSAANGLTAAQAKKAAAALNAIVTRSEMLDWAHLKPTTVAKVRDGFRAAGVV